jgi:ABC-type glycerol-3-phosphate transport system substrate-binding protein
MKAKLSLLLIVLLLTTVFGGVRAQDKITLKLWMHEHTPRIPLDETLIEEFMVANPDIVVEYTHIEVI